MGILIAENHLTIVRENEGTWMDVTIKLVGPFRIARFKEAVHEYPVGTCVSEVVNDLRIPNHLLGIVLINDVHAGIDDVLKDGDALCLLPFMDGG